MTDQNQRDALEQKEQILKDVAAGDRTALVRMMGIKRAYPDYITQEDVQKVIDIYTAYKQAAHDNLSDEVKEFKDSLSSRAGGNVGREE